MSAATQPNHERQAYAAGDVHQRIVEEITQVKKELKKGFWKHWETPACDALMDAADDAVHRGMPTHFEHHGRTYWVRVEALYYVLEVFDSPTARFPLAYALMSGIEAFGHNPCLAEPWVKKLAASVKESEPALGQLDQVQPVERSFCDHWAALMPKESRS